MRGRRLHRLLQVIAMLRGPCSWNARRLAEHFNTSRRNIYRDLAVMELAGIPFYYDHDFGEGGGYRIRESFWFPNVGLTDQECFDLAIVITLVERQGIPLLSEVCQVRDKLYSTLDAKQRSLIVEASALFDILSVRLPELSRSRRIMLALQQALLKKKQIEGTYQSPNHKAAKRIQLQPRRIFLTKGVWYIVAHDNKATITKLYRLSRFETVKVIEKGETIDPNFSLREFLGNAWAVLRGDRDYHVEIEFGADIAAYVAESWWHHTQAVEMRPEGSLLFRATVSGLEEIKYWVLQWGPKATVVRPKELADEVQRLAQGVAQRYPPPASPTSSKSHI